MRTITIPTEVLRRAVEGPVEGTVIEFPVAVDWPELQLTESQIVTNAVARASGKRAPYPDHSIFLVSVPYLSVGPRVAVAPPLDPRVEMSASVEAIAAIIEPWRDGKVLRQRIHAELTRLLEATERLQATAPPSVYAWAQALRAVAPPQEPPT